VGHLSEVGLMRRFSLNALIVLVLSSAAWCCSCIGTERPCENLRSNAAFVGTGIETTQVKRPQSLKPVREEAIVVHLLRPVENS